MQYPLKNWDNLPYGYRFSEPTAYSDFHLGVDKTTPCHTQIYAPCKGRIVNKLNGKQGGLTTHFLDEYGALWRFMHQSEFASGTTFNEGEVIGFVGTTGLSTGCHLHIDISKNGILNLNDLDNFIDPEIYIKNHSLYSMWERLEKKYKEKYLNPTTIPVIKKLDTGTRLDLAIKKSNGEIVYKTNVPLNEWLQNGLGIWD